LLLVASGAVFFLGILALVIDVGWTYYNQLQVQTAVNAGWKAGFDEILSIQAHSKGIFDEAGRHQVITRIKSVVAANYPGTTPPEVVISFDGGNHPSHQCGSVNLTVTGNQDVHLLFAKIFGMMKFQVNAVRSGGSAPISDMGIIPLGIPHGIVKDLSTGSYSCEFFGPTEGFTSGTEYILRLGETLAGVVEASPPAIPESMASRPKNNCGSIDPDNLPGNDLSEYADQLLWSFKLPLQINDRIILQSGFIAEKIDSTVSERISRCGRNVILPITDIPPEVASTGPNSGAQTIYELHGIDNPGGKYASSLEFGFTSAVRIVGFAEFELIKPAEYTRSGSVFAHGDTGQLGPVQRGQIRGRFTRYIFRPGSLPLI